MDAKKLLTYALNKMTPDQASQMLEKSDIVFGIAGTYAKFEKGELRDVNNSSPVAGGVGALTGVRTMAEAKKQLGDKPLNTDQNDVPAPLPEHDSDLSVQHTLIGSGVVRTTSPTAQDGVNVVTQSEVTQRDMNIATNGQATAGDNVAKTTVKPDGSAHTQVVSNEEATRLANAARAAAKAKADAAAKAAAAPKA